MFVKKGYTGYTASMEKQASWLNKSCVCIYALTYGVIPLKNKSSTMHKNSGGKFRTFFKAVTILCPISLVLRYT